MDKITVFIDTNIWLEWRHKKESNTGSRKLIQLLTRYDTNFAIYLPYFSKQEFTYKVIDWEKERWLILEGYSSVELRGAKRDNIMDNNKRKGILKDFNDILSSPKIIQGHTKTLDYELLEDLISHEFGFADAIIISNLVSSCQSESIDLKYFFTKDKMLLTKSRRYKSKLSRGTQITNPTVKFVEALEKYHIKEI